MPGGGNDGGTTSSTTTQELSPEQKEILGLVTPIFKNYLSGGAQGLSGMAYPGSTVAPMTGNEELGAQMLKQQATGSLQTAADSSLQGLNFLTSGAALDPNSNPALQGTIDAAVRPLTKNFGEVIMPGLTDEAVLSGGYGSNRTEINKRAAGEDLLRQIGDTSSTIAYQGYNSGLDAMGRAMAFAPGVMGASQLPGQTVAGIGAFERGFDQAGIEDEMQKYYNERFFPLMIAQQIAGTAFGYPGGSTLATTRGANSGGTSPLAGALGGAALGTSIMPGWGTGIGAGLGALMGIFG